MKTPANYRQNLSVASFGVDYIYSRHGSRFPTGELKELIFITSTDQNVPYRPAIACKQAKVNTIDNQLLKCQNS